MEPLIERYLEPHRHYHTLQHIFEMQMLYGHFFAGSGEPFPHEALLWAIWYHDAIYDPTHRDNEEQSAFLAEKDMAQFDVDGRVIDTTMRLIRSTATHITAETDEMVFSDLDLGILGAPRDRYIEYVQGVRKEYEFVSDSDWANGRSTVLKEFLSRDQIFHFLLGLENEARKNLSWELMLYEESS